MRIAAWISSAGSVMAAAVVEGHGPTVLRALLDEALASVRAAERPQRLTVWPSAKGAVTGLAFPVAETRRDEFLTVVVEDQVSFGHFPRRLAVRRG